MMIAARLLCIAVAPLGIASAQQTAREIVDSIKAHVGVPWREQTVDTIKAGDPETPVTGIATTVMATYDVLERAAASGHNFIITHEPTFYSHQDNVDTLRKDNDAVWAAKEKFIREHKLVVFRFHDHWHMRRPDGIMEGMKNALGWQKYQNAETPSLYTMPETTLESLAADIRSKLKIKVLRVVGSRDMKITKVAMVPGASGPAAHRRMLQRDDVEVLVIGEVPEWETIEYVSDAAAQGKRKALILMGHIPSEQAGMENCATWLKTFMKDTKVAFVPAVEPFWMPK
ncbi:MAG TPA: Nif3-like dinuclear metal center hexameric protein [Bryobacteraceae bacterium]|nr:Nif3-like dinuclear metal center hexameric protein [Bryobacteraceae bacterium]